MRVVQSSTVDRQMIVRSRVAKVGRPLGESVEDLRKSDVRDEVNRRRRELPKDPLHVRC